MDTPGPWTTATATASLDVVLQWDLDLDLTDPALAGVYPIQDVVLPGDWALSIEATAEAVSFTVQHGSLPDGAFGCTVVRSLKLYWLDGDKFNILERSEATLESMPTRGSPSFSTQLGRVALDAAATASRGAFDPASHREYHFKAQICVKEPPIKSSASAPKTLARRLQAVNLTPLPHDVRLYFPLVGECGVELWANSFVLSSASPYLKTLLESDFAESVSKRIKAEPDKAVADDVHSLSTCTKDYEDSDDEADALTTRTRAPKLHDKEAAPDFSFREIKVVDTAYTTYRAVLLYLQTHHITFAPLASSAYRLAHLLELPDLEERCLHELRRSLTVRSAPHELFDDASVCFPAWRAVVLEFVLRHWDSVTASASWHELDERIERDEVRGAAPILREVMKAKLLASMA
ncbi:hypothetical protein JCM3770_004539 [Rhodotorula araucariae]